MLLNRFRGIGLRRWIRIIASRDIGMEKSNASRADKAGIQVVLNEVAQWGPGIHW